MSSNLPPQLHLELPASTTSFKRSFQEFGFDLESPLGGIEAGGSGSDGNDRNKRARSASSFSDDEGSVRSSSSSRIISASSSMNDDPGDTGSPSALTATRPTAALPPPLFALSVTRAPLEPPRLPTPELQDIDMIDYPLVHPHPHVPEPQMLSDSEAPTITPAILQHDDNYRLSLERFNAFDSQIAALRRSPSPRLRSPTPPPVLPPLTLLDDQPQLTANSLPFLHSPTRLSSPPIGAIYDFGPLRPRSGTTHEGSQDIPRTSSHHVEASSRNNISNQFSQEPWSPVSNNIPWVLWPPDVEEGDDNQVLVEVDEGEENNDVHTYLPNRLDAIPLIAELRSPSPLFEDLEELDESEELPSVNARRTVVPPIPPTLPPIQETWDDPLDTLRTYSLDSTMEASASFDRSTQQRNVLLQEFPLYTHGATRSTSASDINGSAAPSPLTPDMDGLMDTEANSQVTPSLGSVMAPAPTENARDGLLLGRVARLEALHGLREALQGIGRVLQESERSLRPQLPNNIVPTNTDTSSSSSSNRNYIGDAWRSGFAEGFASALSDNGTSNASGSTDAVRDSRLWSRAASRSTLESEMRPWFSERSTTEALASSAARAGQLSEEFMHIVRRDNETESRPRAANTVTQEADILQEGERVSRQNVSENPWHGVSSNSWAAIDGVGRFDGLALPRRTRPSSESILASNTPSVSSSSSWRPWLSEGSPPVVVERSPSPELIPSGSTLAPEFTPFVLPHSRLQRHSHTQRNVPISNSTPSTASFATNSGSSPRSPLTIAEHGLFGVRSGNLSNSASLSAISSGTSTMPDGPATLSRFRSRLTLDPPRYTPVTSAGVSDSRPAQTELALESQRRNARIELMERRSRGQMRRQAPEPSGLAEPRPWEFQTRSSSAYQSLSARFLPEPQRPIPPRMVLHRPERDATRDLRSTTNQALLDLEEFPEGPNEDVLELFMGSERDNNHVNPSFTRSAIRTSALDSLRREDGSDSEESLPLLLSRRRHRGTASHPSSTTTHATMRSHRQTVRSSQGYEGSGSHSALQDYLPSPSIPSPNLGELDFGPFTDDRPRPNPSFNSSRAVFREAWGRRSPSPQIIRETLPPTVHRRTSPARAAAAPTSTAGGAIDPNAYAPGPFRNTMQRIYEAHVARENRLSIARGQHQARQSPPAPVIPPLAFDNAFSNLYDPPQQDGSASHRSRPELPLRRYPNRLSALVDGTRSDDSEDDEEWMASRSTNRRPPAPASRPPVNNQANSSRRMLSYLSGMTRFEESRLETPESDREASGRPTGGASHTIQPLRPDSSNLSRSQEIINRFRRERERERAGSQTRNPQPPNSSYLPWGQIERPELAIASVLRREALFEELSSTRHDLELLASRYAEPGLGQQTPLPGSTVQESDRPRLLGSRIRRPRRIQENLFMGGRSELMRALGRRVGALGDYVRDEDFDESYEGLLSLAASIGEAKPRATPDDVIAKMETGLYKDWKTSDSDHRCPICLDDYEAEDSLLKLDGCTHWLHRECLKQWLNGAGTCPVCRKPVESQPRPNNSDAPGPSRLRGPPRNDGRGSNGFRGLGGAGRPGSGDWPPPPWRYGPGE